jgi:hypothetical protein
MRSTALRCSAVMRSRSSSCQRVLHLDAAGNRTSPDTVWNDTYNVAQNELAFGDAGPNPDASNGGVSSIFARPWYQNGVARVVGNARGVPDITMSAACSGAIQDYQSYPGSPAGWYLSCGTSDDGRGTRGITRILL